MLLQEEPVVSRPDGWVAGGSGTKAGVARVNDKHHAPRQAMSLMQSALAKTQRHAETCTLREQTSLRVKS